MIYKVYAIKDELVGFGSIMVEQNEASAVRGFSYACKKADTLMAENKKDYTLYELGTYDTEKGVIEPCAPTVVLNGSSVI